VESAELVNALSRTLLRTVGQTQHGDRGRQTCSSTSKTFMDLIYSFALGGAENWG